MRFRTTTASLTFVMATVAVLAACASPALALNGWTYRQLTYGVKGNRNATVEGDRVAWSRGVDTLFQVFTYRSGDATFTQLSNDTEDVFYPAMREGRIAWAQRSNDAVYTWRPGDATATLVASGAAGDPWDYWPPAVSHDTVAWMGTVAGKRQDLLWSAGDVTPTVFTSSSVTEGVDPPVISADRLAWPQLDGAGHAQIFTRLVGDTGPSQQVTFDPIDHFAVQISSDRLAWRSRTGTFADSVYTWKVLDAAPTLVTDSPGFHDFVLSGDRIAWYDSISGAARPNYVYTWAVGDHSPLLLSTSLQPYTTVAASGDRVIWIDGTQQIVVWRAGHGGPKVAVRPTRVAGDPVESVSMSGTRFVWVGPGQGHSQVYQADYTGLTTTRVPSSGSLNVYRSGGVARWTMSLVLSDFTGPVRGLGVSLQASADGRAWRTVTTRATDSHGAVSVALSARRPSVARLRWLTSDSPKYAPMSTSPQTVTVR